MCCTNRFNIQELYLLSILYIYIYIYICVCVCVCVFYIHLRKKQRLVTLYYVTDSFFLNRDEMCLLRGTNWVFK